MRSHTKFSGTVLVDSGPVLHGELVTDYVALRAGRGTHMPARVYFAVLSFGDHELARWDVTDRRDEFEEQPGDYRSVEDQEQHEEAFVEKFIGEKLAAVFGGLEGVIRP